MFWEQFADQAEEIRGVAAVLRRDSYGLRDVLAEDDVLQECAMSAALLTYLSLPETLVSLVDLVALPSNPSASKEERYRDPFLACELLRFGHPRIMDAFFADGCALLDRLLVGFRSDTPMEHVVAEYVARVLLKEQTLAYVKSHGLLSRCVVHLANTSVLNVLLGVLQAFTVEVEAAGVASELGNARLHRVLPAEAADWLQQSLLVEQSFAQIRVGSAAASNALECLERVTDLCGGATALLAQVGAVGLAHMQRELQQQRSDVEGARAVQLLIRVASRVASPAPPLLDCVRMYSAFAAQTQSLQSLGSVRLECGRLWACAAEHLPPPFTTTDAVDVATLCRLAEWFFAFPRANLFHVACVRLMRAALERDCFLDALLDAHNGLAKRCVEFFAQNGASWPRSPCVGEVVCILDAVRVSDRAPARAFVAAVSAVSSTLWADVAALVEQERKPLANAVVSAVKRNADFVGKADIDGIGERK